MVFIKLEGREPCMIPYTLYIINGVQVLKEYNGNYDEGIVDLLDSFTKEFNVKKENRKNEK